MASIIVIIDNRLLVIANCLTLCLDLFNRSAHSAGPAMNDGKWEIGDGRWEMGDGRCEVGQERWEMGNGSLANFWFHDGMYKMWFV